jgi:hypothetical protein
MGKTTTYLDEANVGALLTEALTADVQAVLADQTSRVGADAAVSTVLAIVSWKPCLLHQVLSNPPLADQHGALALPPAHI